MIKINAFVAGLCIRSRSAPEVAGSWATESKIIFRMMRRTEPSTAARRRNMNFLAVRQGWANARTKAIAARKASRMPGGLSLNPTTAAAIVNKPLITKRIIDWILMRDVENASIIIASFLAVIFVCGYVLPNYILFRQFQRLGSAALSAQRVFGSFLLLDQVPITFYTRSRKPRIWRFAADQSLYGFLISIFGKASLSYRSLVINAHSSRKASIPVRPLKPRSVNHF
jgi:hypothetical protein